MKKINFIELMHKAYNQKEMSADEYLAEKLQNIFPYNLTFKKVEKSDGGENE